MTIRTQQPSPYKVAIIGVGPKGMYAFERLLAQLQNIDSPIEIHLFNRSPYFGAGDIYDIEQPHYLIMNFHSDNIQMWLESSSSKVAMNNKLCFTDWLKKEYVESSFPKDYAPRAVVGEYLHSGFLSLKNDAPKQVKIICHQMEVSKAKANEDGYNLFVKDEQQAIVRVQQLLLATGHPRPQKTAERTRYQSFIKCDNKLSFTDFVYPVTQKLATIKAQSTVLIKGLGLTFIDSVLCLTEGRGGQFLKDKNGDYIYKTSGEEPNYIFPFSRSGLPMVPRNADDNGSNIDLHYFTAEVVKKLKNQHAKIDFTTQILPLIEQEIIVAYYGRLFQQYNEKLNITDDFEVVEKQIEDFCQKYPIKQKSILQTLFTPYSTKGDDQTAFLQYLDRVIEAAQLGQEKSPLAAAVAVWRSVSPGFNELYSFGRFTPLSHREFLKSYAGHFNRIAYGPPLRNMLKIRALARAGILDFSFVRSPELHLDEISACFTLQKGAQAVQGDHLVDARIPKVDLTYEASDLEKSLLQQGIIRLYENKNEKHTFCPGCMELNENAHPINAEGEVVSSITVYGTPTEGITFDNDTLSRTRNDFASYWGKHVAKEIEKFNSNDTYITENQTVIK